eukprot:6205660-Prymnesium_polylepis.1
MTTPTAMSAARKEAAACCASDQPNPPMSAPPHTPHDGSSAVRISAQFSKRVRPGPAIASKPFGASIASAQSIEPRSASAAAVSAAATAAAVVVAVPPRTPTQSSSS